MNDRNPHDFITVDSFSQLPFIRRPIKPPTPPTSPPRPPNIRLFGFNFPSTAGGSTDSKRKFECNYCCRNFPTSQALGGHQNAHKRERQQAKRAHMYGAAVGYHRLGLPVAPATRFPFSHPAAQFHPSWNAAVPPPAGLSSAARPIIGSPLTDMWRIQAAGGEVGCCCPDSSSSSSASPEKESVHDQLKDGVSLDLHL